MQTAAQVVHDHRLTLSEVLRACVAEGVVLKADADKLTADRRLHRGDHHPLVVIADQKWRSHKPPQRFSDSSGSPSGCPPDGMDYSTSIRSSQFLRVTEVCPVITRRAYKILPSKRTLARS